MNRTVKLDGKANKARYTLELIGDEQIEVARYIDPPLPQSPVALSVTDALAAFRVKHNSKLYRLSEPDDFAPDTEIAAYWYTRSGYDEWRFPVLYYHKATMQLIVFPPPQNDNTKILVQIVSNLD
jgi:hypothetical protein